MHRTPISEVNQQNFEAEVLRAALPVLVAFVASWSRPCHVITAVLSEVADACAGQVKVVKVNADDHPELSLWYGVESIPTLLAFAGGRVRAQLVGTASKEAILARLQAVMESNKDDAIRPTNDTTT